MNTEFKFDSAGLHFHARPINASDKDMIRNAFLQLSDRSKFLRFSTIDSKLTDSQLKYLTDVDGMHHIAWGVADVSGDRSVPAGVGRIVRLEEPFDTAEMGITVVDAYQKKGVGKVLFILLNILAGRMGVQKLRYHVQSENHSVLKYLKHFEIVSKVHDGPLTRLETQVVATHRDLADVPEMQEFIATMRAVEALLGV